VSRSSTDKFWHSQQFCHRSSDINLQHVPRAPHAQKAETFGLPQQGEAVFRWTVKDRQPSRLQKAMAAETAEAREQRRVGRHDGGRDRPDTFLSDCAL
jgi:hypothetical protein